MNVSYRCEHEYWEDNEYKLAVADEPLAAISGIVISIIALFNSAGLSNPPLQICLARASLVLCGIGTVVFHAMGEEQMARFHLNGIIFDGVSMALVTVNVFLLHLSDWMRRRRLAVALAVFFYLFFWVITNDLLTFNYLQASTKVNGIALFSVAVQYPTFVLVYVYILCRVDGYYRHWPLWLALVISIYFWCINEFACEVFSLSFVGHVIWHIGIGYVAYYLIVLGAVNTYGYTLGKEVEFFPLLLGEKKRSLDDDCEAGEASVAELDTTYFFKKR
jgi:hypothetical protein